MQEIMNLIQMTLPKRRIYDWGVNVAGLFSLGTVDLREYNEFRQEIFDKLCDAIMVSDVAHEIHPRGNCLPIYCHDYRSFIVLNASKPRQKRLIVRCRFDCV
jgi:hypothetical protein